MSERMRRYAVRALHAALWIAAAWYLFFGGEFTLLDLERLESRRDATAVRLDSLNRLADSLEGRAAALETDSAVIERTARERYGFIRDGEHLFRFLGAEGEGTEGSAPQDGGSPP